MTSSLIDEGKPVIRSKRESLISNSNGTKGKRIEPEMSGIDPDCGSKRDRVRA
jgi:hypothetical protein